MRGKAKQRVSLILVVTMVLGTVLTGNTVFATGESSDEQDRIKINISKDSEQTVEQNVTQTIHVTAQGQCSQSVCLNVYLKNEDGSAATDIDAVNLLTSDQLTDKNTQKTIDETLKDSVTLNNGTKASPTAEWKNDKDDNGTVTSKYLQITMPADAIATLICSFSIVQMKQAIQRKCWLRQRHSKRSRTSQKQLREQTRAKRMKRQLPGKVKQ